MAVVDVRSVVDFVRGRRDRPWLILGKGPTSARLAGVPPHRHHLLSLNHACLLRPPLVAHFTDYDAWCDCRAAVEPHPDVHVCSPWHPHVAMRPSRDDLGQFLHYRPLLASGRLLSYNSSLCGLRRRGLPVIRVRHFSAVAAFNVLAAAGVREVHTLGVDGGTAYNPAFDPKDRLANGRASFDPQFEEFERTCRKQRVRWVRL